MATSRRATLAVLVAVALCGLPSCRCEEIAPELLEPAGGDGGGEEAAAADHSIASKLEEIGKQAAGEGAGPSESPARALERLVARGRFAEATAFARGRGEDALAVGGLAAALEAGMASYVASLEAVRTSASAPRSEAPSLNSGAVGGAVVVTPAFRWAQNSSHLFVEVRFAHSLTAPANTDAFVEGATVEARAFSLFAGTKHVSGKRWELRLLDLWEDLDEKTSDATSSRASAGRVVVYLGKRAVGTKWPRLIACGAKNPPNSAMWIDMQQSLGLDYFPGDTADDACEGYDAKAKKPAAAAAAADAEDAAFEDFLDDALAGDGKKKKATTTTAAAAKKKKSSPEEKRAKTAIKNLKKNATKARKAVAEDVGKRKKAVEADLRAANLKLREDFDARVMFVDHAPTWVPAWLPRRVLVRDGFWTWFLNIAHARRNDDLKGALHAKLTKYATAAAAFAALLAGSALLSGAGADIALAAVVIAAAVVAAVALLLRMLHAAN